MLNAALIHCFGAFRSQYTYNTFQLLISPMITYPYIGTPDFLLVAKMLLNLLQYLSWYMVILLFDQVLQIYNSLSPKLFLHPYISYASSQKAYDRLAFQ